MDLNDHKLEITYPARWTYKVIGEDEVALRAAVAEVVGERDHSLEFSRTSRANRYVSLTLVLVVSSEADRHGLFERLAAHPSVKFVL